MGMFDIIRSSYDIGPGFWNRELQTKDLDCILAIYWIDPAGRFFHIDCSGVADWDVHPVMGWKIKLNGNHGKIRPMLYTGEIEVYPSKWDSLYAPFPRKKIKFIDGVLQ